MPLPKTSALKSQLNIREDVNKTLPQPVMTNYFKTFHDLDVQGKMDKKTSDWLLAVILTHLENIEKIIKEVL